MCIDFKLSFSTFYVLSPFFLIVKDGVGFKVEPLKTNVSSAIITVNIFTVKPNLKQKLKNNFYVFDI